MSGEREKDDHEMAIAEGKDMCQSQVGTGWEELAQDSSVPKYQGNLDLEELNDIFYDAFYVDL